jgi:SAM-dependent methyltransferase
MSRVRTAEPADAQVVWHDLECGGYLADLPLWRELAERASDARPACEVLDLGSGTGRVSLDLAARGHRVTGLDLDRRFVHELRRRAAARNVAAGAVVGDVRGFDLGRRFDLVLAPMQLLELLDGSTERVAALRRVRAHVRDGGLFAASLLDLGDEPTGDDYLPPLPDMREQDGWVWSSQPVSIRFEDEGTALTLERARRAVSPAGEIADTEDSVRLELVSPAALEEELRAAGITPTERRAIGPTDDHVGSMVVIGVVR